MQGLIHRNRQPQPTPRVGRAHRRRGDTRQNRPRARPTIFPAPAGRAPRLPWRHVLDKAGALVVPVLIAPHNQHRSPATSAAVANPRSARGKTPTEIVMSHWPVRRTRRSLPPPWARPPRWPGGSTAPSLSRPRRCSRPSSKAASVQRPVRLCEQVKAGAHRPGNGRSVLPDDGGLVRRDALAVAGGRRGVAEQRPRPSRRRGGRRRLRCGCGPARHSNNRVGSGGSGRGGTSAEKIGSYSRADHTFSVGNMVCRVVRHATLSVVPATAGAAPVKPIAVWTNKTQNCTSWSNCHRCAARPNSRGACLIRRTARRSAVVVAKHQARPHRQSKPF